MNVTQAKKTILKIQQLEKDIDELNRVRMELASSGYSSATISSSGGSKSYTRHDLSKISELISTMTNELKRYRTMLRNGNLLSDKILTVYC
ncbi:MAG: hypothetical protein IJR99_06945 [Kiritimatiellae bacterium]|nr:hypothetical protein [Kiritimatiellia bacterium]